MSLNRPGAPHHRALVALLRRAAVALKAAEAVVHHSAGRTLRPLLALTVVLKRLRAPATPANPIALAVHDAAGAAKAAAVAAQAATLAARHVGGDPLVFYEVAAVVIPLLFVALIYQAGVLEQRLMEDGQSFRDYFVFASAWRYLAAALFLVSGASEVLALRALSRGPPVAPSQHELVASGLVILGTTVLLAPILTVSQMFLRRANSWTVPRALRAIDAGAALAWVAFAAVVLARVWGAS